MKNRTTGLPAAQPRSLRHREQPKAAPLNLAVKGHLQMKIHPESSGKKEGEKYERTGGSKRHLQDL